MLQVINDDRLPFPSNKIHSHADRARVGLVVEADKLADAFGLHVFRLLCCVGLSKKIVLDVAVLRL